jgi:hypothetical protein
MTNIAWYEPQIDNIKSIIRVKCSKAPFLYLDPIKNLDEVIYQSDPHKMGSTITAEAFATKVNVIKLGIFGMLHINGLNKHHIITKRYIFD